MAGHTRDERVILSDGAIAAEPILRKVDSKRSIEGLLIAVTLERITGQLRNENHLRAQRASSSGTSSTTCIPHRNDAMPDDSAGPDQTRT